MRQRPSCIFFLGGGVRLSTSCRPLGPMPNGFVQSMMILPARLPRLLTAACVVDHGVAITTISADPTASVGRLRRSFGRAAYFGFGRIAYTPDYILAMLKPGSTEGRSYRSGTNDCNTHDCLLDLPLKFHPAAIRASAFDTPCRPVGAIGQHAEILNSTA